MQQRSRARVALVFVTLLLFGACEEEDGGTAPGEDVYGIWELVGEPLYLHLEEEQVTTYDENEVSDCYDVNVLPVIDREGDFFTLDENGTEITAEIRRVGDGLVIESDGDDATYTWAGDVALDELTEC